MTTQARRVAATTAWVTSLIFVPPANYPSADGLAVSIQPGPMPFVVAALAWLAVAKPWRTITDRHRVGSPAT